MTRVGYWLHRICRKVISAKHRMKALLFYKLIFRRFGHRTIVMNPVLIANPQAIELGDHVHIRDGCRLEVVFDGVNAAPLLTIGSHTNIEQNVHIVCHCRVDIGQRVSITANCAIVDATHPPPLPGEVASFSSRLDTEPSFVTIGDDCFIGIGTVILPNVTIGHHAIIGANSVVQTDIPPYCIAAGQPARVIQLLRSGAQ